MTPRLRSSSTDRGRGASTTTTTTMMMQSEGPRTDDLQLTSILRHIYDMTGLQRSLKRALRDQQQTTLTDARISNGRRRLQCDVFAKEEVIASTVSSILSQLSLSEKQEMNGLLLRPLFSGIVDTDVVAANLLSAWKHGCDAVIASLVAASFHAHDRMAHGTDSIISFMRSPDTQEEFNKYVKIVRDALASRLTPDVEKTPQTTNYTMQSVAGVVDVIADMSKYLSYTDIVRLKQTCRCIHSTIDSIMETRWFARQHLESSLGKVDGLRIRVINTIPPNTPISALPDSYLETLLLISGVTHPVLKSRIPSDRIRAKCEATDMGVTSSYLQISASEHLDAIEQQRVRDRALQCVTLTKDPRFALEVFFTAAADGSNGSMLEDLLTISDEGRLPVNLRQYALAGMLVALKKESLSPMLILTRIARSEDIAFAMRRAVMGGVSDVHLVRLLVNASEERFCLRILESLGRMPGMVFIDSEFVRLMAMRVGHMDAYDAYIRRGHWLENGNDS